jgi:hypothetical protein
LLSHAHFNKALKNKMMLSWTSHSLYYKTNPFFPSSCAGPFTVFAAAAPKPRAPRTRKPKTTKTAKTAPAEEPAAAAAAAVVVPEPAAHAAPAVVSSSSDDDELQRLHQELMGQIEERKRAQAELTAQLGVAAPAPAAA